MGGNFLSEELDLVDFLENESFSRTNLNRIIEYCFRMGKAHVAFSYNRIRNLNESLYMSVDDIAIDAIAHLFVKNEKHNRLNICLFFNTWETEIKNEKDARYFFRKIVNYSVEQKIHALLKQNNPNFSRILDKVKYQLKKYDYEKIKINGIVFISRNTKLQGYFLDYSDLSDILNDIRMNADNLDMKDLFHAANELYENPYIPVNELVNFLNEADTVSGPPASRSEHFTPDYIVLDILDKVTSLLEKEIKNTYILKGKINDEEGEYILKALELVITDVRYGHKIMGLKKYFLTANSNIPDNEYEQKYHNIFEYMVKKLKNYLGKHIITAV